MKIVDRVFGWLLGLGAVGHSLGSIKAYGNNHEMLLWSLGTSLAILLLAAVNLLRVGRPGDHALAWVSFAGCIGWLVAAFAFGRLIENLLDFRALVNMVTAAVLAGFSLRTAFGKARVS